MLNFEKRLKELNSEKEKILKKRKEIEERFDTEIQKVEDKIKQLEAYKDQIGELTEKQVSILTSANDLAGAPAYIKQEGLEVSENIAEPEQPNDIPVPENSDSEFNSEDSEEIRKVSI